MGQILQNKSCLEEHFPHSMAKAVVDAAKKRKLDHEEMHSKVEYIVAHGISTTIEGKKAIIGSSHFVFEDEKCTIPEGMEEKFKNLPNEYSHLYLAIEGKLEAVILIEDPLRENAKDTIKKLKKKKTYYIKVRAYKKTASGKKTFGAYSKVVKIKISK